MARGAVDVHRDDSAEGAMSGVVGRSAKSGGKGRGRTGAALPPPKSYTRQSTRWKHPDGIPLTEVEVGGYYDGVVTNCGRYGVFVDFGAVKDGLVRVPIRVGRNLKRGMELQGLRVLSCDPSAERVILQPDEGSLPEPASLQAAPSGNTRSRSAPSRPARGSAQARTRRSGSVPAQRRALQMLGDADRVPLEELQAGTVLDGVVKNVGPYGVFLDIGAAGDARVLIPTRVGRRLFRRGDVIKDCHVDWVDADLRRIQVSIPEPEGFTEALNAAPTQPAGKGSAQVSVPELEGVAEASNAGPRQPAGKGSAQAGQPRSAVVSGASAPLPLEAIQEGSMVDGYVRNKGPSGIFVDIGCAKAARLTVPRELARQIQRGDEVIGMHVDKVDLERGWITVSIEDPELAITDEGMLPEPKATTKEQVATKPMAASAAPAPRPKPEHLSMPTVGEFLDGTVARAGPSGVYVEVGRGMTGRLALPTALLQQFRKGDQVYGMRVEQIGPRPNEMELSLEEPRLNVERGEVPVAGRGVAAPAPAPALGGVATGRRPVRARPGGLPLEKLHVGALVAGAVARLGPQGVFVDFGAACDGRLRISREDAKKLQIGDEVEGMLIESVDLRLQEVTLSLTYELGDEPYEAEPPPTPAPRPHAAAAFASRTGAKRGLRA